MFKQLISEVRQPFTRADGVRHVDYEYKREGTRTLYMLCESLGGFRKVLVKERQDRLTWAGVVAHLVEDLTARTRRYPGAESITLVQDNLSAHTVSALYEVFEAERARRIVRKLEMVSTPVHGSWLNRAEIELSVLVRQGLCRRIGDASQLEGEIAAWYQARNAKQRGVDWQFTTADTRVKLKRLYPSIIT
ncbi:MAG: transposase [Rhodothermaceae bacterium]|nr:MAG: transposase [Rhodothermaceae bacterium]